MIASLSRRMIFCLALIGCLSCAAVAQQGPSKERAPISTSYDDYAPAFRPVADGYELWFTSGAGMINGKSRRIQFASCTRSGIGVASILKDASITRSETNGAVEVLDGVPTFSACDGNHGCFVSNRLVEGHSYDNDIYEMWYEGGMWHATRIDIINSEAWDDTPALSPDGRILFFASDRARRFSQKADLYYSIRKEKGWTVPAPLSAVNNLDASQECPYAGPDGYFYYATNRNGDYDIWRAKIGPDGLPLDEGTPLDEHEFPGVNRKGTNEIHPTLSPGGNWFLWSSSKVHGGDYDIFWQRRPKVDLHLDLIVRLRTRERDFTKGILGDSLATLQTTVTGFDVDQQRNFEYQTNRSGLSEIPLWYEGIDPGADHRYRKLIVTAKSPSPQFVSSSDTLLMDVFCRRKIEHELFVWDTASYRNPGCRQEFPIYNVRFFVNGYWCPTTKLFKAYTPCASLFIDSTCLNMSCNENELYKFSVVREHVAPCVDVAEFDRRGGEFSREVDSSIVLLRAAMRSAFLQPCMIKAIRQRKNIEIEVVGSTDPRALRDFCTYTGPSYDQIKRFAEADPRIVPFIMKGQRFVSAGYGGQHGGNQLLSDLRAYYTALLLDSIWTEFIPQYAGLRSSGRLTLKAFGEGISKETAAVYERQRSIRVRISAPDAVEESRAGVLAEPGSLRIVCSECDLADQQLSAGPSEGAKGTIPANRNEQNSIGFIVPDSAILIPTDDRSARTGDTLTYTEVAKEARLIPPCRYSINLRTSDEKQALERMSEAIKKKGTSDVRIDSKDIAGLIVYRLLAGCYISFDDAVQGLLGVQWIVKEYNLQEQPTVVKLP